MHLPSIAHPHQRQPLATVPSRPNEVYKAYYAFNLLRIGRGQSSGHYFHPGAHSLDQDMGGSSATRQGSFVRANGGSRQSMDPRIACLPFLDTHGWPGDGGPSMDPAIPCLHKGHILDSIKSVAVFSCAHLRTQCYKQVVYKYCSFFPQRLDILFSHRGIQNCISNL